MELYASPRLSTHVNPHCNAEGDASHLILIVGAILHNDREPPEHRLKEALSVLSRGSIAFRPEPGESSAPAEPRGGLAPWQIRRVIAYVDLHLADTIDTRLLARLANLSKCHFARSFRRSLLEPPHRYIMRRRIEQARNLMLTSNAPLCRIAAECGLTDQAHFCRLFRRFFGESPKAWRRARMGMSEDATAIAAMANRDQ